MTERRTTSAAARARCRFCGEYLHPFVDLGMSPLCESFVAPEDLYTMEPFYPLNVQICGGCFLVQLPEYVGPENIFTEYAYFSSFSDSYVAHAQDYVDMICRRLRLDKNSQVVELASNDGYLLQHFVARGIPAIGVEPAANVAQAAMARGVPTVVRFFNEGTAHEMAEQMKLADLVIGNNVLAQVPDLNTFVAGIRLILAPRGVATLEFPHLMRLMDNNQYDTIYHEHFSYFSLMTAERIFAAHGLRVFDVEEIWTHGGSLRIYACHKDCAQHTTSPRLLALRQREAQAGFAHLDTYRAFAEKPKAAKRDLLEFLIRTRRDGKSVVGYGAPGKGNTLLNYCGIRTDFIDYVVDRNPYKHGKYLPGTHIPIHPVGRVDETRPDYLLILAWNLKEEVMGQMAHIRGWGGRFIVPIPQVVVYP